MNKVLALFFLLFTSLLSFAQDTILETNIDSWFCCDLDAALVDMSETYNLKFHYDKAKLKEIRFTEHPRNKPLKDVLDNICKYNKLKYFVNDDQTIWVVDKWFQRGQETVFETKVFTGASTKENFSIAGQVVDELSHESLPFVSISVQGNTKGTISNVDGNFTLINIPTDTSTIVFSYIGYEKKEVFLSPKTITSDLLITLKQQALVLNEVNVTAEIQDVMQVSKQQAGIYKMSPIKLQTLPNLGEKDILRSFQLMPGISAANENSSGLYVRGGTPDQVLVLYDGFTVYNVEHMFGFFSAFNSNAIKDVQLFKGGFDAKYGGRLASVVEITGKDGNQKGFNIAGDISMMSGNAFIEFPVGNKITATLSGRRSWKSPLYDKLFEQYTDVDEGGPQTGFRLGGGTQQTTSYFYDMNAKVTYSPSVKDRISFSFYNGKDELSNELNPDAGGRPGGEEVSIESVDETSWGNTGASINWSRQFSDRFYMNALVSYSNYFSLRDKSSSGSMISSDGESTSFTRGITEDNNLLDYTSKMDFEYQLNESNHIQFGAQVTHNDIDYTYVNADTLTIIDRKTTGQIYTGYLQDKLNLFDGKLIITPGLRYNYFTGTQKNYFEPRLISVYNLSDKWRIKASYGDYYQFASRVIREDVTGGSRDFWVLADDDQLPVSSSRQYILGAAYETPDYLFDVEAFYKDMEISRNILYE
ncbi:TonB-dependent receptor domain-containing protein [Lentimicrobium sp. S6]|uniref:TonB-dependent receptor domain-containing protein n=1 Tax=Lentimicrobium sp. S6 TaxID=2735872 RepID=UPI001553A52E|nr:TonB-dependent receptor [Lentimicrobium sp. S6]NPD47889.1 TonB-dependent receptor [Lentimicrobium sp. S6]